MKKTLMVCGCDVLPGDIVISLKFPSSLGSYKMFYLVVATSPRSNNNDGKDMLDILVISSNGSLTKDNFYDDEFAEVIRACPI